MTRARFRTNWQVLMDEVESALRACEGFPASVQIDGRLNRLEAGLNHQNYLSLPNTPYSLPANDLRFDTSGDVAMLRRPFSRHPEAVKYGCFA